MQRLVEQRGMRAQLRSGNLLTGQLFVAFDFFPNAPKVKIDWRQEATELPVVPSTVSDLEAKSSPASSRSSTSCRSKRSVTTHEGARLARPNTEERRQGGEPHRRRSHARLENHGRRNAPRDCFGDRVLKNADATLVGKDAPAQQELREALQEITRAARSLRVLTDFLERHPEALIRGKTEE